MKTNKVMIKCMGRETHGENPCINPLDMARLMLRLQHRRENPPTKFRCFAQWLRNKLFR